MTLSSFTKTVAPGLRIGYVVAPESLATAVGKYAENTYISPCMVSQAGLAAYCEAGYFEPGVERAKQELKARCDAMVESVRAHFPAGAQMVVPRGRVLPLDRPRAGRRHDGARRARGRGRRARSSRAPTSSPTAAARRACASPSPRCRRIASARASSASARSSPPASRPEPAMPLDDLLAGQPRLGGGRGRARSPASSGASRRSRRRATCGSAARTAACRRTRSPARIRARSSCTATSPTSSCTPTSTACRCCSTRSRCSGVEEIVVCGHLGCGGVVAALEGRRHGLIDNWLRHVQDVAHEHARSAAPRRGGRPRRSALPAQRRRAGHERLPHDDRPGGLGAGAALNVHGVVYGLADGVLRDLGVSTGAAATRSTSAGGGGWRADPRPAGS